jgi:hypothetical protein
MAIFQHVWRFGGNRNQDTWSLNRDSNHWTKCSVWSYDWPASLSHIRYCIHKSVSRLKLTTILKQTRLWILWTFLKLSVIWVGYERLRHNIWSPTCILFIQLRTAALRLIVRSELDVPTFVTRRLHACHHLRAPSGGRWNCRREMAGNFA